jgi:hypothetical protein
VRAAYPSGIVSQAHGHRQARPFTDLGSETWKILTYAPEDQQLTEFREAVDDAEPNFVPNLHLHHFGRKTGPHTLSIF